MDSSDIGLRDGRSVQVRAMTPADESELLQAFERLSDEARYMRFMHVVREPDIGRLRSTLASIPQDGIGIVATVAAPDGIDIVGSAIAVFAGDRTNCEFAITVGASFRGVGLAGADATLIDEASAAGVPEMVGYVLADNPSMLGLARRLGFASRATPATATVRISGRRSNSTSRSVGSPAAAWRPAALGSVRSPRGC